ncbi:hypothetical protein Sjap_022165 [Stephania japonica]|uniref:Kinesin motor domain-containing protein n=1 Tax=Stephania japonica TaxID=461633 RepID=A0AAP0EVL5_9MAGN
MSYEGDKDFPEFTSPITAQNLSSRGCHGTYFGNDEDESSMESVLCFPGSRLIPTGLTEIDSTGDHLSILSMCLSVSLVLIDSEDIVMFVNAGGGLLFEGKGDFLKKLKPDFCFQGGQVSRTEENLIEGGDYPSIYQSLRYGNFCYKFDNLLPGDYIIDLHFAEIIYSNGPKGMRVFNVFLQEEKVVSKLDIYSIVGANKPLQLLGIRVSVGDNGVIVLRFEGVHGSPMISGICIKRASKFSATEVKVDPLICNQCAAQVEVPPNRLMQLKCTVKYEKKIQELTLQCQLKSDECYEAWMSLTAANEQLDKVRMELGDKIYHAHCLEKAMENQTTTLKDISSRYEKDKELWITALSNLEGKVMMMKKEQYQLSREAHECADSIPELNKMVYAVGDLVSQYEDLKLKCRPLNKEEISAGYSTVIDFDAAKDGYLGVLPRASSKKLFKFDRVFTPKDDQVAVFEDASPVVISVLDGYNVCIFAYGQTGTGKTFTMEGTAQNRGVNYRTVEELFKVVKERSDTVTYNISVSVLEVYNEQIRDLLAVPTTSKKLEIRQASEGVHHVPGLLEAKAGNVKEVWDVLQAGSNARAVGSNNVNEHSSRSHCMLCITVIAKNMINGECTKSKLWLVDLAGSERLAKTDVQGDRLKEAQNINKSLSSLGDVVSALANKSSHVPFRNSKLTHLLQDSLGGDSKMLMFVQISPSENDLGETLSSLNFATRVRGVELGPAKKQIDMGELQKTKVMLDKAKQESRIKEESFRKLEENFQNLENSTRLKDQLCKSQLEKVKELQVQLDLKIESHNQMEKQLLYLNEQLKGREENCMILQNKVKELDDLLKKQAQEQSESSSLQQKVKELENKLKQHAQQQSVSSSLQQKVMELENKLKEQVQQQPETLILQLKVKELENKLKERDQGSEHRLLHQKVKELENKLKERDQNSEHAFLHQKVIPSNIISSVHSELEEKLRHRARLSETFPLSHFGESSRFTPNEGKVRLSEETMSEHNLQILQSSNSINRPSRESDLLRGIDSLREVRRKREVRSGENENNCCATVLNKKKIESKKARQVPGELDKGRQVCNAKPLERLTRTIKPVTSQRQFSHSRTNRDQALGTKEREKTRIWSR